jgi:hypothetical protein
MKFWQVLLFTLFVFASAKKETMVCNDNGFCKESKALFKERVNHQFLTNHSFKSEFLKSLHKSKEWILVPMTSGAHYYHNKVTKVDQREAPLDLIDFDF